MTVYSLITMRFGSSLGGLRLRWSDIISGICYLQFKKPEVKIQMMHVDSLIDSTILLEGQGCCTIDQWI